MKCAPLRISHCGTVFIRYRTSTDWAQAPVQILLRALGFVTPQLALHHVHAVFRTRMHFRNRSKLSNAPTTPSYVNHTALFEVPIAVLLQVGHLTGNFTQFFLPDFRLFPRQSQLPLHFFFVLQVPEGPPNKCQALGGWGSFGFSGRMGQALTTTTMTYIPHCTFQWTK